jgi:hypothetical protein
VRKYPHPEFDEVISTVCESKCEDEVEGACRLLLENELLGIEFRERLLDKIEENNIYASRKRYLLIFEKAQLGRQDNMRDPLNKKRQEVEADYQYYQSLAERAKQLKR